ncbi:MAG: hypothetical protein PHO83_03740 [Geobacteraceae bacterium]|nr:hypothetical protein [Geobacteraceae bacterium]
MKRFVSWFMYRRNRKLQEQRAASLAVQLVLNGCLSPPRLAGFKGSIERVRGITPPAFQVIVGPGGVA